MQKNKAVLIAVSGGADSMTLLDMFYKQYNIKAVLHVNYNHRKTAYRDFCIVKKYCHQKHLRFIYFKINKNYYQKHKIKNFEAWARKIRYNFFLKIAKLTHCYTLLTAHHLDDFIETALMQTLKLQDRFYYGMYQTNHWKQLNIFRPFLFKYTKQDLLNYCKQKHISFGYDETNDDLTYKRNYIRNCLSKDKARKAILYKQINVLNQILKKQLAEVKEIFLRFKNTKFNLVWLKQQNISLNIYFKIIHLFLWHKKIKNISWNKTWNIYQFLQNNLNFKQLRIANNIYLNKLKKDKEQIYLNLINQ